MLKRVVKIVDNKPVLERRLGSLLFAIGLLIVTFPADALGWLAAPPAVASVMAGVALWERAKSFPERRAQIKRDEHALYDYLDSERM